MGHLAIDLSCWIC